MNNYLLSEITIYPIKSLSGISLQSSIVEERGLKYDRRWMLIYESGMFFTQRDHPQMALLQPQFNNGALSIKHKQEKLSPIEIPGKPDGNSEIMVTVWNDQCKAQTYNSNVDEWFCRALGFKCRLVYMPDSTERQVSPQNANNKIVSFADGYPFLIIGEESLRDLNDKLEELLPMNRFRTNFVFSGGNSFDDDKRKNIKISTVDFLVLKPCARCTITTVNQDTGIKGKEPLTTLAMFRKVKGKVLFGQNMVCETTGIVSVGDEIQVKQWNTDNIPT
jgi:uncharacterized protein YcbX